jgi:hypothetical protein
MYASARTISNHDDIIDSRDVIARIEELEDDRAIVSEDQLAAEMAGKEPTTTLAEWDEDNGAELKALRALAEEAEGYAADWRHGEALIRDSYFQTYAQELAEDIGAINREASWPNTCIDWEEAAEQLQQDYTSVDFDGVTYWIR